MKTDMTVILHSVPRGISIVRAFNSTCELSFSFKCWLVCKTGNRELAIVPARRAHRYAIESVTHRHAADRIACWAT